MRSLVGLVACASFAACSFGLDSDEFSSNPPVADSGTDTAATPDAETNIDAGTDSSPAGPWCADPARGAFLFCADFDEDPITKGFGATSSTFSEILPETVHFKSAPRALRLRHEPRDGGAPGTVHLGVDVTLAPVLRLAFDARPESLIGAATEDPFQELVSVLAPGMGGRGVLLSGRQLTCYTGSAYEKKDLLRTPALGEWHHWELTLLTSATNVRTVVTRDGMPAADETCAVAFESSAAVHIGPDHVFEHHDWDVLYDNVLVTEVK